MQTFLATFGPREFNNSIKSEVAASPHIDSYSFCEFIFSFIIHRPQYLLPIHKYCGRYHFPFNEEIPNACLCATEVTCWVISESREERIWNHRVKIADFLLKGYFLIL